MNAVTPIKPEVSTFVFSDTFPTKYGIGHNDHAVRVVQIDGDPWFVAADVCRALGLAGAGHQTGNHTKHLNKDEKQTIRNPVTHKPGMGQQAPRFSIISESGLYKLVMRSDKPQAKQFQDWVTRDVLTTIRKTGQYNTSAAAVAKGEMSFAEMTAKVMQGLLEQVELEKKKAEKLEHRNKNLTKVNASLTDELHYVTVREFLDHHLGIYAAPGLSVRLGKAATKICVANGYELRKEYKELVRYGREIMSPINVYPSEVLLEAWEKNVRHFYEAQKVH
nr:BRO family protein [uncultured Cohaesibacter sp.]